MGDGWREGRYWQRGAKRKNWDNCNNIIKHTFKKEQDSKFLIIYKTTITKALGRDFQTDINKRIGT